MYNIIKSSQQSPDVKKTLEVTPEIRIKSREYKDQKSTFTRPLTHDEKVAADIISQAQAQAKKIVDQAQNYSIYYMKSTADRINAQLQNAMDQADSENYSTASKKGYEEGFQKGYQDGLAQAQAEMQQLLTFSENMVEGIDSGIQDMLKKYEEELYLLAFSIAKMIIKKELELSSDALKSIVENAALQCKNQGSLRINISVNNYKMFMSKECDIINRMNNISDDIKFIADPNMSDTDCVIETPIGVIDASVDTQLDNINMGLIHRHK
ncbi:FliH/SctL family protein [Paludicola sp. MB14-C6]|uniref:FliH/SctL family protein n=1 Tax=Paludihabitans sp. MB14-C6 TaxID=3070656 RepID=UPI0027DDEE0D|nr:FliH/SctL family protein [Paludicola sp. MB14-C6]WMJ24249.1 FliH/SctL family protein [Paludicola sp. MB14-C6]